MTSVLIIAIFAVLLYVFAEKLYQELKYKNEQPLHKNFPFTWRGVKYWYSRSCAVVLFAFCKDKDGNLCILANRRGLGTPDFQGYWNAPCGYLDFNEKLEDACCREALEETGIKISPSSLELRGISSDPSDNKQNVTCRYSVLLEGTIDDYTFNTDKMEKDEVAEVKWVNITNGEVNQHNWAFGHKDLINQLVQKYL